MKIGIGAAHGKLDLRLGWRGLWRSVTIWGGPFSNWDKQMFGVCLRGELHKAPECDIWLPIDDYSVPESDGDVTLTIIEIFQRALAGQPVYVGCLGGMGRTGLVLALLAKAAGESDPVSFVRANYFVRAVETKKQAEYIADFDVGPIRAWMLGHSIERALGLDPAPRVQLIAEKPNLDRPGVDPHFW